jgi:hypothetical protein
LYDPQSNTYNVVPADFAVRNDALKNQIDSLISYNLGRDPDKKMFSGSFCIAR